MSHVAYFRVTHSPYGSFATKSPPFTDCHEPLCHQFDYIIRWLELREVKKTSESSGEAELASDDASSFTLESAELASVLRKEIRLTSQASLATRSGHAHLMQLGAVIESQRSNANTGERNSLAFKRVTNSANPLSGNGQETGGTTWLDLTSIEIRLRFVIDHWHLLCDEQRQLIADVCGAERVDISVKTSI